LPCGYRRQPCQDNERSHDVCPPTLGEAEYTSALSSVPTFEAKPLVSC
jgi:hypothetical protein